jgi:hypothetical protein
MLAILIKLTFKCIASEMTYHCVLKAYNDCTDVWACQMQ